jgi:hypothetical protein
VKILFLTNVVLAEDAEKAEIAELNPLLVLFFADSAFLALSARTLLKDIN